MAGENWTLWRTMASKSQLSCHSFHGKMTVSMPTASSPVTTVSKILKPVGLSTRNFQYQVKMDKPGIPIKNYWNSMSKENWQLTNFFLNWFNHACCTWKRSIIATTKSKLRKHHQYNLWLNDYIIPFINAYIDWNINKRITLIIWGVVVLSRRGLKGGRVVIPSIKQLVQSNKIVWILSL